MTTTNPNSAPDYRRNPDAAAAFWLRNLRKTTAEQRAWLDLWPEYLHDGDGVDWGDVATLRRAYELTFESVWVLSYAFHDNDNEDMAADTNGDPFPKVTDYPATVTPRPTTKPITNPDFEDEAEVLEFTVIVAHKDGGEDILAEHHTGTAEEMAARLKYMRAAVTSPHVEVFAKVTTSVLS